MTHAPPARPFYVLLVPPDWCQRGVFAVWGMSPRSWSCFSRCRDSSTRNLNYIQGLCGKKNRRNGGRRSRRSTANCSRRPTRSGNPRRTPSKVSINAWKNGRARKPQIMTVPTTLRSFCLCKIIFEKLLCGVWNRVRGVANSRLFNKWSLPPESKLVMLVVWRQAIVVNSPRCAFSCLAIVANMSIARNLTGIDLPVGDNHGRENSHQLFTSKMCVNDNEQRGKVSRDVWTFGCVCVRIAKNYLVFICLEIFSFCVNRLLCFFFQRKCRSWKARFRPWQDEGLATIRMPFAAFVHCRLVGPVLFVLNAGFGPRQGVDFCVLICRVLCSFAVLSCAPCQRLAFLTVNLKRTCKWTCSSLPEASRGHPLVHR